MDGHKQDRLTTDGLKAYDDDGFNHHYNLVLLSQKGVLLDCLVNRIAMLWFCLVDVKLFISKQSGQRLLWFSVGKKFLVTIIERRNMILT